MFKIHFVIPAWMMLFDTGIAVLVSFRSLLVECGGVFNCFPYVFGADMTKLPNICAAVEQLSFLKSLRPVCVCVRSNFHSISFQNMYFTEFANYWGGGIQAAFADDASAVRRLIDNRVHVNASDDNGRTAMVSYSRLILFFEFWSICLLKLNNYVVRG